MQPFSLSEYREARFERLKQAALDVLIIGGGIVGAGVARDAAMRGLRVGLVEQYDFASGTSSRTSRLLHGGLRYLAQGRLGLVWESSVEKRIIHHMAPHLAEPLAFVFPTYRGTAWPRWQLRFGVKVYDLLCGGRNFGASGSLSAGELLQHVPGLRGVNLTGGVRYFDGLTNDARLVVDTLRSAASHGAIIANYTRLESAERHASGWQCDVQDRLSGHWGQVVARSVVNATGPWAPSVPHSSLRLRLTKGVHLVIDRRRLPIPDAVVLTEGHRILFAIPWAERIILGTTDTDYEGPPEAVKTEPADAQYILDVVNGAFPGAGLHPRDIQSTWAGVRPLIAARRGGPSDISRAHQIAMPEPGWIDVAGGKLTTYRRIAQQVVDRLFAHLGRKSPPCRSAKVRLLATDEQDDSRGMDTAEFSGIVPPSVCREAIEHYCHREWAVHLDDIMLRRAGWHYYLSHAEEVARQVAGWMSEILACDASWREAELSRYQHNQWVATSSSPA